MATPAEVIKTLDAQINGGASSASLEARTALLIKLRALYILSTKIEAENEGEKLRAMGRAWNRINCECKADKGDASS